MRKSREPKALPQGRPQTIALSSDLALFILTC